MRSFSLFLRATFVASLMVTAATRVAVAQSDVTSPADAVVGVQAIAGGDSAIGMVGTTAATNNWPGAETPNLAFDNNSANPGATKYLNFAKTGTGVVVTPAAPSIVTGLKLYAANDAPERDPFTYTLEGTNAANPTALGTLWSLISSGDTGLQTDPGRFVAGPAISFTNVADYTSYRLLFPTVRDSATANSMQIGEIELLGSIVPEPATIGLLGSGLLGCGLLRRRRGH